MSSTCFEHPGVHHQEDLYMLFYATSFMNPCKQCGRWQGVPSEGTSCHSPCPGHPTAWPGEVPFLYEDPVKVLPSPGQWEWIFVILLSASHISLYSLVIYTYFIQYLNFIFLSLYLYLRWSRVSVLAFSTQFRGFKPGRSRRKNPQHAFLRRVSEAVGPMS